MVELGLSKEGEGKRQGEGEGGRAERKEGERESKLMTFN